MLGQCWKAIVTHMPVVCLLREGRTLETHKRHVLATAQIKGFQHSRHQDGCAMSNILNVNNNDPRNR